MEPDQQLSAEKNDQEKLQTAEKQDKATEPPTKQIEEASPEPVVPIEPHTAAEPPVEEATEPTVKAPETPVKDEEEIKPKVEENEAEVKAEPVLDTQTVETKPEEPATSEDTSRNEAEKAVEEAEKPVTIKTEVERKTPSPTDDNLPSFPGTVTKSVPGSEDVKIEIDSSSLLDRVILYTLKNTKVDHSRLDAAKNKYMMNNGTPSFNSNSNGSDSNSSSKSVEKLIEEFKGGCSKSSSEAAQTEPMALEKMKSDISIESSNGAETCVIASNRISLGNDDKETVVKETQQNVIKSSSSSPDAEHRDAHESIKTESCVALPESKPSLENEALDFRDKRSPRLSESSNEAAMLDLSIPHRDEKSMPIIKRNHALYVGLPDFSKQIFAAPSINRPNNAALSQESRPSSSVGPPKIKNPDFSSMPRGAPELQMRHPDFSKSFGKTENPPTSAPVTPLNFTEIVRKNNYIADLQLKPPANPYQSTPASATPTSASSTSSSSSYKIDYRSAISQKLMQETKPEQPSTSQTVYPNMKKEGINAYNQQMNIDEPMPHIIHKNQFLPGSSDPSRIGGWNDRGERLLGGSSASVERPKVPHHLAEADTKPKLPLAPQQFHNSSEDLRKSHPAYYPPHSREFNNNQQELAHEFSLKQKEQQLRQEGTIITIKNEPTKTPTLELTERRSADLFRDYKLKQPKESPDSARRSAEHSIANYQQAYPDYPPNYPKFNHQPKPETIAKPNHSSPAPPPLAYPQERQMKQMPTSSRNYHSPSPVSYHHQPKSPLTVPLGPSLMNPPQNWPPPPLVQQPMSRHGSSPSMAPSSTPPNHYQHHPSSSQSPHMNYGYPYPAPPQGPTAVKVNANYQPYKTSEHYPSRGGDVKEMTSRPHYQPPTSSSQAAQNYYHQKFPDFARHFDPEAQKKANHEQAGRYPPPGFHPAEQRPPAPSEINYPRYPPHQHELEMRREQQYRQEAAGPSYYREREAAVIQDYPPRPQEQITRHQVPLRVVDDAYERSRVNQPPLKVERRIDEPPKIIAGPSNLPLRRPEPTDVSIIAKVKLEPMPVPPRNVPPTSLAKSLKSPFTEVKRESPLDLSVKTVKTKADSTGCDQDMSRQRPEPSGLKVDFAPNFSKVSKSDCRQQSRHGPHDYPQPGKSSTQSVPEKPSGSHRTHQSAAPPQIPHPQHQVPHASSNRNFFHEQRFQPVKEMERPHAPVPALPNSSQYLENRPGYPSESKPHHMIEQQTQRMAPSSVSQAYPHKEIPRPDDRQHHVDARRMNSYYIPPHQAPPAEVPYTAQVNKPTHHPPADTSRPPNLMPNPRDPSCYEEEKNRKLVMDVLYGRRKEAGPPHPDLRHFQSTIVSPPRKRMIEQHHMNSSAPQKQPRPDEPPMRMEQDVRSTAPHLPHHPQAPPNFYDPARFQSIEKPGQPPLGHPPALVKNEAKTAYKPSPYYPNPKAEMIHRSDPTSSYKQERLPFPNQNFQQRPDDNTLQSNPRIHHPIQLESAIKNEHQPAGPSPGTSGESARLLNGILPPSISGSNGNIAQSTILKLKENLELKEQKKLTITKPELDDSDQKKDLSPNQFRTKAAMKCFIPLPANADSKVATATVALPALPSAFDMLDWGSACNDFVQQLETGKKQPKKKRSMNSKSIEGKQDEKLAESIPGTTSTIVSEIPKEVMQSINKEEKNSSSDEDKPLLELVNPQGDAKMTDVEKNSRNVREKQRLELEQKRAARLGKPSSSESETDARRPARTITKVRRLRKRAALGIKKTDEEPSVEEEETEEEPTKRRIKRSTSKHDNLTSSDDEKDEKKRSRDKRGDDKKSSKGAKKSVTPKQDAKDSAKKLETSSDESDSDETTVDKMNKLSSAKNAKKLKDLGDGSSIKNLLEEGETMTRSKRKLEIEKKLSNSKVLRNEKVVRNIVPDKRAKIETPPASVKKSPPKRKDSTKTDETKRKMNESGSDTSKKSKKKLRRVSKVGSSSSSEESPAEEDNKAERLRPRKTKPETEPAKASKKKIDDKSKAVDENTAESEPKPSLPCRIPFSGMFPFKDEKASKFTPGWEDATYKYKLANKVPRDPQTSDTSEIFSEFVKSKDKDGSREDIVAEASRETPSRKSASIIDLLHKRAVLNSRKKLKASKKPSSVVGSSAQANDDDDLLPTPEKESEKVFGFKVNIFETSIITSRTRTENNALRKKEIMKEVFGADDERPKSAPPAGVEPVEPPTAVTTPEVEKAMSFDQKYREYIENMNNDFLNKTSDSSKIEECKTADTSVKDEEDDDDDDNETVVSSVRDLAMPLLKGKSKKGRSRRCKGSSGFDYIRKKKKPTSNAIENPMSVNNMIKKRLAAMENLENKDENDISREIKGWVLNKGVGESVLYKAARLDYVDVVAYCLDRLNMNPDIKTNAGFTALHEACAKGHLEIARILLQYGANHSEAALSGIRPLHEAIENGHIEIVRLLISYGADPCLATYSGQLPIAMAEDKEMEDFLGDYLIDIDDKKGKTKSWYFDGPYKAEDPSEQGYEVFNEVPINKADLGLSNASVFSTSLTSLVTATTQMSDAETVSETTATPTKAPETPMKAPSQDAIKYQHKMKKRDTNSNNLVMSDVSPQDNSKVTPTGKKTKGCSVVLNNIDSAMKKIKKLPAIPSKQEQITPPKLMEPIQKLEEIKHKEDYDDVVDAENLESDSEVLEVEESEAPLPPLYLLRDEGNDKWILLADLCNLLKVKSKDAVLKQICPSSPPSTNKELIRELKMSDFLEKAICLQLFCAGEKINVRASKVSLVRYNDSVRNLLGVQTIRMNM